MLTGTRSIASRPQAKEGVYQAVTVLITGKPAGKPTVVAAQSGALPETARD